MTLFGGQSYDITLLKRVYTLSNREMRVRTVVIVVAAVVVGWALGQWPLALWMAGYLALLECYNRVLRGLPDRAGWVRMWPVVLAEAGTVVMWLGSLTFLVLNDHEAIRALALIVLGAILTVSVGERSGDPIMRWSDRILLTLGLTGFAAFGLYRHQMAAESIVLALICLLMLAWAQGMLAQTARFQQELRRRDQEAMARQRIESMGRLTGGVAHDFNNILTVIGGNLDLAREVADPVERAGLLAEAREATRRAAAVTAQLLAYSRQSVLTPVETELCPCLTRVEAFLTRLLPETVTLTFHAPPETPRLILDPNRFETALINLILNARDAMPTGGPITVNIGLDARPPSGAAPAPGYVCVTVADRGTGISADIIDRVAEPYFTTKPVGKGSGLGLSMAKGFAEQSGGMMHIESQPGKGTAVRLFFPVPDLSGAAYSARSAATMATI